MTREYAKINWRQTTPADDIRPTTVGAASRMH